MTKREQLLRDGLARLLDMDSREISLDTPFAQLGVDSLLGLRYARHIADQLRVEIDLEWLYEYQNIRELSQFLDGRFGSLNEELLSSDLPPEYGR